MNADEQAKMIDDKLIQFTRRRELIMCLEVRFKDMGLHRRKWDH